MLSFLRARPMRSSPSADLRWSGRELIVRIDPARAIARVALDLDGSFFSEAPVDALGEARFAFPFAPDAQSAFLRDGRGGAPLVDAPFATRFGSSDESGARHVPFGVDCASNEVAIVVPVYGAPALVERCLDSVFAHATGRARLIVIDDASPDAAIAPLLARYGSRKNVTVLRNERNRGFTATANRGIAEAGRADVVLLNADAEVGPNWLTGLRRAAASGDDVATVTAVSDNAGAFSVPELECENAWPSRWTFVETARALWQHAGHAYPALPTGNGFCMYVRREVVDAVGMLDEAAFPQGYGEENDFCQRASARGRSHLIAGNVYVHHARSASFGHERRAELGAAGMQVLRARWPRYEHDVASMLCSYERHVLDWRVRRLFATAETFAPELRVRELDGAMDEREAWNLLQADAIEAVAVDAECPNALSRVAAMLGVPLARRAHGESIASCGARAIMAARSFPETP
jgi:GT2 family glycosyltransferase